MNEKRQCLQFNVNVLDLDFRWKFQHTFKENVLLFSEKEDDR